MKKLLSSALFSLLFIGAQAQISYGPKLAINLATQSWKGEGSSDYTRGFIFGLQMGGFANYEINEKLSGQAELIYSMEGTSQKSKEGSSSGNLRGNYLRIPVLGQYKLSDDFFLQTGPSLGFLLSASQKWNGETYKSTAGTNNMDFGWNFGGGYNLSSVVEGLTADVRFYLGLTNTTTAARNGGSDFKNRSIALGIQYAIPKK